MNPNPERVETSPSIDELRLQHQNHERRLEELRQLPRLTPEEEMEEKRLKKLKLQLKDRIELLRSKRSS